MNNRRFGIIRFLGAGFFGRVYLAYDKKLNMYVACKFSAKNRKEIDQTILREIAILKLIAHKNIIKLYDYTKTAQGLTLIMEYAKYTLPKYLENTSVDLVEIIKQILMGLNVLHDNKIIHRDLKPDNILVNAEGTVKIADFGNSIIDSSNYMATHVCTLNYRSLEMLENKEDYGPYIDMWSFGCLTYEIIFSRMLFPGLTTNHVMDSIRKMRKFGLRNHIKRNFPRFASHVRELIVRSCDVNYERRMTVKGALKLLLLYHFQCDEPIYNNVYIINEYDDV